MHADDPRKLRGYWTKSRQIYKQCREIIDIESPETGIWNYDIPIRSGIPGRQMESRLILPLKLVTMATSTELSEKEGQVSNLGSNTYHLVKIGPVDPDING